VSVRLKKGLGERSCASAQKGRLSAPRQADEGDKPAPCDLQIDAAERLHGPVGGVEAQRKPVDLNRRVGARRSGGCLLVLEDAVRTITSLAIE